MPEFDPAVYHSTLGARILDFDASGRPSPLQHRRPDRACQLAVIACDEAMAAAGFTPPLQAGSRAGLVLGTTLGGMNAGLDFYRQYLQGGVEAEKLLDFPPHVANDYLASGWHVSGPSLVLSTACAASTHAIGFAADLIRSGQLDMAVTGGYDPFSDLTFAGFGVLGLLTTDAVRPFDQHRSGLVLGEGAGILILEAWDHAVRRGGTILAEMRGFGMTSDAFHMTAPEADGQGAARAMQQALADAGLTPADIDYINAHGTGTKKNDLAETTAIKKVFGARAYEIPVSSTKSMLGHTLGAAGAIELIATILAMHSDFLPPTINYQTPDPACDLDYVANRARPYVFDTALSNSFGFGGNNGCLVVSKVKS